MLKDLELKQGFLRLIKICSASIQGSVNIQISQPDDSKYVPIFQELFKRPVESKENEDQQNDLNI